MNESKKFLILVILVSSSLLLGVDTPTEPQTPVVPIPQNSSDPPKEKKGKKSLSVTLRLCDGREVSGTTEYTKEDITFQHDRDGIKYNKKIYLSTIKQIYIKNFLPKQLKKNTNGTTFQFDPFEIEITGHDNEVYKLSGLTNTDFQKIVLSNQNGSTTLFTYWIDLQYDTGRWYSKLPTFRTNAREECHPDVVRTIKFENSDIL